jgi:hypothetical protein
MKKKKKVKTKKIIRRRRTVVRKQNKGEGMSTFCYVFISEFDNEYDGSTVIAQSREDAIKLIAQRIPWVETEWEVSEVEIPREGIIIENSIPEDKGY